MPSKLKTGWKRIGRSGPTVDGRNIEPEALRQVANNYDPDLYKALIWPDHQRWFNMGGVDALRAEDNDEGGVDLFAVLSPNEYYLSINRAGQRLFTSMELFDDFRGSGEYYLTGLGATDSPASAATSEVRFSRVNEPSVVLSQHTENTTHEFNDDDDSQPPRWFQRFFNKKPEGDMSEKQLLAIQASLTALAERFNAAFSASNTPDTPQPKSDLSAPENQQFSGLSEQLKEFSARLDALESKKTDTPTAATATVTADEFAALKAGLEKLTEDFKAALKEQPGTDSGDHVTDGEDLNAYV